MMKVIAYPLSHSLYTSQIYAGLFDLAANGEISLEFTWRPSARISERDWGKRTNNRIAYLELHENGKRVRLCYDMLDGPEIISLSGLEKCDLYFKRSYCSSYLESQSDPWQGAHPEWRKKIQPYGLNFPCDSVYEFAAVRRVLIYCYATGMYHKSPKDAFRHVVRELLGRSRKKLVPEVAPAQPAQNRILFQTRLFDPSMRSYAEEAEALNRTRVEIIKALKEAFGDRFVGGLIDSEYSRKNYPSLLTKEESVQDKYFELVKNSRVVVFTRGLRQSIGWRLPELLAMSRCLVCEPLAYQLPDPLRNDENYLLFNSPEECVKACDRILGDEAYAQRMRENNYDYYMRYVRPSSLISNTLDVAKAYLD